jgi:hypothetical protein
LISLQLAIVLPVIQSAFSSSTVMQSTQSLAELTTTVSASVAMCSSVYSIPFSSQSAISSSAMAREALAMSVSPAQKASKPPPVPDVPTEISTSPATALNSSAAACATGATVLEPSAAIEPPRLP